MCANHQKREQKHEILPLHSVGGESNCSRPHCTDVDVWQRRHKADQRQMITKIRASQTTACLCGDNRQYRAFWQCFDSLFAARLEGDDQTRGAAAASRGQARAAAEARPARHSANVKQPMRNVDARAAEREVREDPERGSTGCQHNVMKHCDKLKLERLSRSASTGCRST